MTARSAGSASRSRGITFRPDSLTYRSAPVTTPFEAVLREVCLRIHATRRVSSLSSSLVQRLGLAQSLIGSPRAILLDETICGEGLLFDRDIVSLLTRLGRRGITIILAAPNPVELHRITARIINIVEGRVVAARLQPAARVAERFG